MNTNRSGRDAEGKDDIRILVDAIFSKGKVAKFIKVREVGRKEYFRNPNTIDFAKIKDEGKNTGTLTLKAMAYGGGSSIIIEFRNGDKYILSRLRHSNAPSYPNTLSALTGVSDSPTVLPLLKEAVEEVLIFYDGKVLVPEFIEEPFIRYNKFVERIVRETMKAFREFYPDDDVPEDCLMKKVRLGKMLNPLYLEKDVPIGVGFYKQRGIGFDGRPEKGDNIGFFDIILPPLLMQLDLEPSDPRISFRDTLGLEMGIKERELDVVLLKVGGSRKSPEMIVYKEGRLYRKFDSVKDYVEYKRGERIDVTAERLYEPAFETLLSYAGYRKTHNLAYYPTLSELFDERVQK
jgi:hypothetical protein